jgi:glutathione S-transferase
MGWELPLQPHNGGVEPDWTFITTNGAKAKREAVERLSANHVNVVKFVSQGMGKKGICDMYDDHDSC